MALTQLQIQLCSQEGNKAAQDCIKTSRIQTSANIAVIQEYYRRAGVANSNAWTACKAKVPGGGCPPTSTEDTLENRNKCASCWEAYSKEQARLLSEEFDRIAEEQRLLEEKTNQRYDPLGNPLPGCKCCDEGRTAEAACRRRGATPIAKPIVPQPGRPRDILDDAMEKRTRLLFGPMLM